MHKKICEALERRKRSTVCLCTIEAQRKFSVDCIWCWVIQGSLVVFISFYKKPNTIEGFFHKERQLQSLSAEIFQLRWLVGLLLLVVTVFQICIRLWRGPLISWGRACSSSACTGHGNGNLTKMIKYFLISVVLSKMCFKNQQHYICTGWTHGLDNIACFSAGLTCPYGWLFLKKDIPVWVVLHCLFSSGVEYKLLAFPKSECVWIKLLKNGFLWVLLFFFHLNWSINAT